MFNTLRVSFFLAWRQITRNNKRSVAMIVAVMVLTFLNLVAVSGILVGLIEGSSKEYRERYTGDVVISPLSDKNNIVDTTEIENFLRGNNLGLFSTRYLQGAQVEANFTSRKEGKDKDVVGTTVVGMKPSQENALTGFEEMVEYGEPLVDGDRGKIIIGSELASQYAALDDEELVLQDVQIGDKVILTVKDAKFEFTVKGFVKSKADQVSRRVYLVEEDLRSIAGYVDKRAQEIAIRKADPNQSDNELKQILVDNGFGVNQKIQTYQDAEPTFVADIKKTFALLGNFFGSIGLIVAFITIFIVIYINAITRRKYIGIMKGIGIAPSVIETSYVMQSIFYGVLGSLIGAMIVYLILVPLLLAYPINFPFSDGILVAPIKDTFIKFLILMFSTILAGYLPARNIVKQNTLNAILGR